MLKLKSAVLVQPPEMEAVRREGGTMGGRRGKRERREGVGRRGYMYWEDVACGETLRGGIDSFE